MERMHQSYISFQNFGEHLLPVPLRLYIHELNETKIVTVNSRK